MFNKLKMYRIGTGYDVHKLVEGSGLRVGGVEIAHTHTLEAHSDGDVLLHALCDALLGALALGDIGGHFSDQDDTYKGIDSKELLRRVYAMITERGYCLINVDNTIIAQAPKFAPYIESMRGTIATLLCTTIDRVSVKATTTEKLGFEGRKEGIAAQSTVLVKKM